MYKQLKSSLSKHQNPTSHISKTNCGSRNNTFIAPDISTNATPISITSSLLIHSDPHYGFLLTKRNPSTEMDHQNVHKYAAGLIYTYLTDTTDTTPERCISPRRASFPVRNSIEHFRLLLSSIQVCSSPLCVDGTLPITRVACGICSKASFFSPTYTCSSCSRCSSNPARHLETV